MGPALRVEIVDADVRPAEALFVEYGPFEDDNGTLSSSFLNRNINVYSFHSIGSLILLVLLYSG